MPGHMGQVRRTVQNLRVVKVIAEKNLILVKGAIPGANGDDVIVRSAVKGQPPAPVVAAPVAGKPGAKK
jgi:large subunit ribosomal protein L3